MARLRGTKSQHESETHRLYSDVRHRVDAFRDAIRCRDKLRAKSDLELAWSRFRAANRSHAHTEPFEDYPLYADFNSDLAKEVEAILHGGLNGCWRDW